jgi:hypothetical protein
MPLKKSDAHYTDQTGTSETITIEPLPPQTSTQVAFAAATYGTKPDNTPQRLPGKVAGMQSLTFNVLPGNNRLLFGLVSPTAQLQSVRIMQDATLLCTVSVQLHSGTGEFRITGTPAPAASEGQS